MIGKLIVFAKDWKRVVKKAERALDEYVIEGIPTNIPLHQQIVKDQDFRDAKFDTGYFEKNLDNFNLEADNARIKEEERIKELAALIQKIKENNIHVR